MRVFRDASTFGKWYVDYFWHGKRVRLMAGSSQAAANKLRNRIENDINAGKHDPARLRQELRGRNPGGFTFHELCDTFLRLYRSRGGTAYYAQRIATYKKFFTAETLVAAITPLEVNKLRAWSHEHGQSDGTIRKSMISLGTIFRWAMGQGLASENPADPVRAKRPAIPEGRVLILTGDQLTKLIETCPQDLRRLVHFLSKTGMRLSEPLRLKWSDVDSKANLIHVRERKMGRSMHYPLTPLLKEILGSGVRHFSSEWVFADGDGQPWNHNEASKRIKAMMVAIGVPAASAHTLRHTAASEWAENGVPMELIGELLGQRSAYVTSKYTHLTPESKRRRMLALHSEGAADDDAETGRGKKGS